MISTVPSERKPSFSPSSTPSLSPAKKKRRKEFDMSRYGQRLVALRIAYQGWRYHGFAAQSNNSNTVEQHIFNSLITTHLIKSRDTCEYSRSGRTDVGVSATGQIIGVRLRSIVAPPSKGSMELDYLRVINARLPDGISVLAWAPVPDGTSSIPQLYDGDPPHIRQHWKAVADGTVQSGEVRRPGLAFSARFDAISRSYKYFFVKGVMNLDAMCKAVTFFEGNHDFRNFCRIDENVTNFERLMYDVQIRRANDDSVVCLGEEEADEYAMYYIFVRGQAFLWHQIRCMAAVLFDIGLQREHPSLVQRMLADAKTGMAQFGKGRPHYRMASATPLVLSECAYPPTVLYFGHNFDREKQRDIEKKANGGLNDASIKRTSFERADGQLAKGYAESRAKASIMRSILRENDDLISTGTDSMEKNGKTFRELRAAREYLLDVNIGKHIPYDMRPCDPSVEEKQQNLLDKKKRKEQESEACTS